uniref:Uncharacterized protein n=1 Tax=Arundo donax TaxID=35708 RepID=A0A0A8ZQG7_ARUDO
MNCYWKHSKYGGVWWLKMQKSIHFCCIQSIFDHQFIFFELSFCPFQPKFRKCVLQFFLTNSHSI